MKKALALCTLAAVMALLISGGKAEKMDDSLSRVKAQGYFIVGLDDSFPPMGFRDSAGNIVGFDIDLAKEAAKRMGVEARFKPVDWDGVILSLQKGDIDLIWNGMTITDSRKEKINFSDVYLANRQIIVVRGDSTIANKADLAGKVVGLQMGSSSEEALAGDAATSKTLKDVKKYSNNIEALLDLAAGRTEAVVVDEIVGRYYIAKKPGEYKVIKDDFGSESYGVGVRKEDVAFLAELNRVMTEMKKDGGADRISVEWFGEPIVVK